MADFVSIEKKWQEKWEEDKAFEPRVDEGREKFFFTVPYPYVSGSLHVGHGRTYTNGDVIARFKRMKGFNVLWPMAWHITGTPVLAISARIAEGDEGTISLYKDYVGIYETDESKVDGIVKSFSEPWNVVNYFSKKMIQDFKSIGFSIDFTRQFTTGDLEYNKFVEWQFAKYKEKGYLKQAAYPIVYCVKDKNAVGEDDIRDGDVDPVELQTFTALKHKFEDGFIVTGCLRPDTYFGITNIFVNDERTYVKAAVDGETWFVSEEAAAKLSLQGHEVRVIEKLRGNYFVEKTCTPPNGLTVPILPGSFVKTNWASGFVHSEPADAPFDLIALEDLKKDEKILSKYPGIREQIEKIRYLPPNELDGYSEYPAIDKIKKFGIKSLKDEEKLDKATQELYKEEFYSARMTKICGEFAGMLVKEAEPKIVEHLKSRKLAFDFFETSRKAQCRCGGEIVVAVLPDQWFLDFNANDWKEKSFKCLEKMIIFPEEYRKQFNDTFNWLDKRPCARRRGLGTKLPYNKEWIIESLSDSTIYMAFYTVIKKIREFSLKPENLVEEFFDYVFLGRGTAVEISGKCGTTASNLDSIRSEFLYWYPNDQRHTSIAHVTNHLSFFIFAHAGIFEERHWPKAITLNNMLIAEGSKMSKSKGNIIPLNDIQEKYSADLFRLYVASAADFGGVLDFRDREVEHARKSLQKFAFVIEEAIASQDSGDSRMSKWLESRFQNSVKKAEEALEAFGVREYVQTAFYGVLRDVDYFNRRTGGKESSTVRKIAREWVLLLSPVIPHLCEELWEKMKEKGFASHAAWPTVVEGKINPVAEGEELFVQSVLQDARSIQKITKGVSKNARIIIAKGGKWQEASDTLSKAKSPEEIPEVSQSVKSLLQKRFYELKENGLKKMDEQSIIEDAKEFLRRETGITFSTEREEESKSARREKAAPTKPAIELY